MKQSTSKKILLLLIITPVMLVIQLGIGFLIYQGVQSISKTEAEQSKVDTYLRTNTKFIANAESAQRGYLLTSDKKYEKTFESDREEIAKNETYFNTLPQELKPKEIEDIQRLSANKFNEMQVTISLYNQGYKDSALNIVKAGSGKLVMDSIRSSTTNLRTHIATSIADKKTSERHLFILFLSIIALLIVFNLFLVWYSYKKLKAYTENLEHLVASLEDANGRMKKYTFMSYHDLKTPLRGISSFAQLLGKKLEHRLDSEEKEYVQYITENVKKMDSTINQMRKKYLTEREIDHTPIH